MGAAAQISLVAVTPLILLPLLVLEIAEDSGAIASRVIVVSMVVCGLTTLLSTVRIGPLRSNNLYIAVMDPMSIPFCILALDGGGLATLAVLVVVAGLFQILVGMRLANLRKIITPTFTATILILACISVAPVFLGAIDTVSGARFPLAVPVCMAVSAAAIYLIGRLAPKPVQSWAALLGLVVGTIAAIAYGIYDLDRVREAAWVGLPTAGWDILGSGVDRSPFDSTFFSLLLSFLVLSLVLVVRTSTSSLIAQLSSQRDAQVLDFREVQRANSRIGMGSVLSGVGGSMPLSYSPVGTSALLQTGCDARQLGTLMGGFFLLVALCPKFQALMIAIPRALIGVYLIFILLPLATRVVSAPSRAVRDLRIHAMMTIPIAVGLVFELELIPFPSGAGWSAVSQNGLTAGTVVLLALAFTQRLVASRRSIDTELNPADVARIPADVAKIKDFVAGLAPKRPWSEATRRNLEAVAEEAFLILTQRDESQDPGTSRRLRLTATVTNTSVELEFLCAPTSAQNLEERIALLEEPEAEGLEAIIERDAPLRLLSHYAASVSHRQYRQAEIVTAVVAVD